MKNDRQLLAALEAITPKAQEAFIPYRDNHPFAAQIKAETRIVRDLFENCFMQGYANGYGAATLRLVTELPVGKLATLSWHASQVNHPLRQQIATLPIGLRLTLKLAFVDGFRSGWREYAEQRAADGGK